MSWSLSKPNVSLRVTKFAPDTAPTPAGLSPEDREAHRAKRAAECAKVEPAVALESADIGWDEPETYDDYTADPRSDYARDVGMPLRERIR